VIPEFIACHLNVLWIRPSLLKSSLKRVVGRFAADAVRNLSLKLQQAWKRSRNRFARDGNRDGNKPLKLKLRLSALVAVVRVVRMQPWKLQLTSLVRV